MEKQIAIDLKTIMWVLRFVIFLTFLGHGFFALITNPNWVVYLTTVGFSVEFAQQLMPLIGFLDIAVAFCILIKPIRIIVLWACIWTFATALIRPISGESIWAFIERGANWGAPLILYLILNKNKNDN